MRRLAATTAAHKKRGWALRPAFACRLITYTLPKAFQKAMKRRTCALLRQRFGLHALRSRLPLHDFTLFPEKATVKVQYAWRIVCIYSTFDFLAFACLACQGRALPLPTARESWAILTSSDGYAHFCSRCAWKALAPAPASIAAASKSNFKIPATVYNAWLFKSWRFDELKLVVIPRRC